MPLSPIVTKDLGQIGVLGGYGYCRKFIHSSYNNGLPVVKKTNVNNSKDNLRRFKLEHKMQSNLSHEANFVEIYSPVIKDSSGDRYYLMELAEGGTLKDYIENNPAMTTDERLNLVEGVCIGLSIAHQKGFVHRDLHFNNVLIKLENGKPIPVIVDFGRGRDFNSPARSKGNQILMMPYLFSPEALFRRHDANPQLQYRSADIYALGLMIHNIMSGQFGASTYVTQLFRSVYNYMSVNSLTMDVSYAPILSASYTYLAREKHYREWLKTNTVDVATSLRTIASNRTAEFNDLFNDIIQGSVTLDNRKRYNSVVDLLQRIQYARSR
jgi:serine/threonine protein kinase